MFATPDGDVFDLYAKRGASANAYTTFNHTAYLFSCTSMFDENLATLLSTLSAMHADAKAIAREKGIIGQEIAMYDDDASWRGYFGLLGALYRDHPIRLDPAGTKETIAPIDRDVLVRTHAAYYHPANLILCVAGDVDPAAVLAAAEATLVAKTPGAVNRRPPTPEPSAPATAERRESLSVSRPQVTLGWKDSPTGAGGRALLDREAETEVVLDALFGDGGLVEAPLYRDGVVDESFSASYQAEADYGFAAVSAEVDDAEAYRTRLLAEIERARRAGITAAHVERARRRALGGYVRTFNSPERAASLLLGTALKDVTIAESVEAVLRVTPARAAARLEALLACGHAWSTIVPKSAAASAKRG
jgi:predicted Zn-dependent peptidase